ncbi:hypothetical protein NCG89_06795 [Spongiibacter taiwanensis]|uniref:ShlB/FhaC/HecB family hemolysin secretion/activation protein n=1 Tax=Spongiibacter taiwanensis TaxID=1748242 RepID=UPI0020364E14|nr:ShlB/FhaC/HecB family hemolysin secretion/activation protein [Spongiibacter taiwanensis]USA44476.1 hypothetical protein NCG89_06795 [Spongiibacter taiwanensis]
MAIDMLPAMQPVEMNDATFTSLSKDNAFYQAEVAGLKVVVLSAPYVQPKDLKVLADAAKNPSQFILGLNQVYYLRGNLLVQLAYRQVGTTVYVYGVQSILERFEAPNGIEGFFESLEGDQDLTVAEYERRRVLANIQSGRQGINYGVTYKVSADLRRTSVSLAPRETDLDTTSFTVDVGNQGNRFIGRNFAHAGLSTGFDNGVEVRFDYHKALTSIGDANEDNEYDGIVFAADVATRAGLYGIDVTNAEYRRLVTERSGGGLGCGFLGSCNQEVVLLDLDAEMTRVGISGQQILKAVPGKRLTISQRLDTISDETEDFRQGVILDESYRVAELGTKYVTAGWGRNRKDSFQLGLSVKKGFGGDGGTFEAIDDETVVGPGRRSGDFIIVAPSIAAAFDVSERGRLSMSLSSQFALDEQVPQAQQYALGGMSSLSAYLPGVLVGDSGYYGRLSLGRTPAESGFSISPSVFVEMGSARFENVTGELDEERRISSAGVGLQLNAGKSVELSVVAARGVSSNLDDDYLEEYEVDAFAKLKVKF